MTKGGRIESIDLLRGLVMVIMALDHTRDYFHFGAFAYDPVDMSTTYPALFFTRWITHFCAPIFVLLAGTSAYLYGSKQKSKVELSKFLMTRGIWLIFIEFTVVSFAWTFNFQFDFFILQVIWAIGLSMMILSLIVHLPKTAILALGLVLVGFHNILDPLEVEMVRFPELWKVLHVSGFISLGQSGAGAMLVYPVIPWLGLMSLGYCLGTWYVAGYSAEKRKRNLLLCGILLLMVFIVFRFFNFYGDMRPWIHQDSFVGSLMSFFNTTKYPPSLLYVCMTIGPAFILLSLIENWRNRSAQFFVTFGRVPFFYYILHLYIIHLGAVLAMVLTGGSWTDMVITPDAFGSDVLAHYGFSMLFTYVVWLGIVFSLFPLCRKYMIYKAENKDKWWLSYL